MKHNYKNRDYYLTLDSKIWRGNKIIINENPYKFKVNEIGSVDINLSFLNSPDMIGAILNCFNLDCKRLINPHFSIVTAFILSDILHKEYKIDYKEILSDQELFQKDLDGFLTTQYYNYNFIPFISGTDIVYTNYVKYSLGFISEIPLYKDITKKYIIGKGTELEYPKLDDVIDYSLTYDKWG
jgi:hypothetical protein